MYILYLCLLRMNQTWISWSLVWCNPAHAVLSAVISRFVPRLHMLRLSKKDFIYISRKFASYKKLSILILEDIRVTSFFNW